MQTCPRCKLEDALELDHEALADRAVCDECGARYAVEWDAECDSDDWSSSWEIAELIHAPRLSLRRRLGLWWERRKADARWVRWRLRGNR